MANSSELKDSTKDSIRKAVADQPYLRVDLEAGFTYLEGLSDETPPLTDVTYAEEDSVTVALISDSDGNSYMNILPGTLSVREVAIQVYSSNPGAWHDLEDLRVDQLTVLKIR